MVNVALNKTCTAFSFYGAGYEPGKAVDGNTSTGYVSNAGNAPNNEYWQVDLGGIYTISSVSIRADASGARNSYLQVNVSNNSDGSSPTNFGNTGSATATPTTLSGSATGRYVRIYRSQATGAGANYDQLWLYEVDVQGVGGASFTLSPNTATTGTPATVTATGSGTAWTSSTVFSVTGGTGASISANNNVSATSQTFTLNPGSATGTLTISNNTDSATATVTVSPPSALVAGTISFVSATGSTIALSSTAATGGTGTKYYQWHRSLTTGFTPSGATAISGATSLTLNDTGLTSETLYYYKLVVTDSATPTPATTTTAEVAVYTAQPIFLGAIGDSIYSGYNIPSLVQTVLQTLNVPGIGTRSVTLSNQGVSGSNSSQWVPGQTNYTTALSAFNTASSGFAAGLKLILIMLGTNDAKNSVATATATYQSNILSTANGLIAASYKVVANAPTYAGSAATTTTSGDLTSALGNPRIKEYARALTKIANQKTLFLGDLGSYYGISQADTTFLGDGIHPTATGQALISGAQAAKAWEALFGTQATSTARRVIQVGR